ncbi:KAP family NTPase [Clostridium sp. FP2]|uniref:P-loop NTPase fold protein n=1 Tax=Clostridium sp. FP2 TaxID=2724481 RepID=UPI001CCC9B77|nr:P-loop NTPase fold protein [Clostridium sp. FP2]MBZ9623652.1 KAP family NTPase [Clostridium sp. FP2]
MTDEQITEMLIEYLRDSRYKQAILIDGEWGSGKTFFVEEKLLPELKINLPWSSVFYISLYGLNNFDQIMNELYTAAFEEFFDKKLGEGKGEKIGKGLNFASKLLSVGLKQFNIDAKDLPSLSDIKKIKDAVIIFDDLERCNININQLLGFINNLVEHNNIKVIIVANQAEVGKTEISKDLPQKYLIALDARINFEEVNDGNKDEKKNNLINKEKLISRSDKLFSEDILYNKVKEKLIGITIYYQADFSSIYESIIEKYMVDKTKTQLLISKQDILDIFKNQQHYNIRTLIFGMMAYEKFYNILDTINFDSPQYLQEQKERILKYTMELSIQIKSGKAPYSWNNTTAQTGLVYWGKSALHGKSVFGYKFVDTYLIHRYLNSDEIKNIITLNMVEKKENDDSHKAKNVLVLNELYRWWELEDEEIPVLLSKMKSELVEQKYSPRDFKEMILMLMQMSKHNLAGIEYEDYIPLMKIKLETHNEPFERRNFEVLSDEPSFVQQYNTLAQPLFDVIDKKEKESKKEHHYFLDYRQSWNENFASRCGENSSYFLQEKKFFFYMVPDKIIDKLKVSSVKEIYSFIEGIKMVYSFSNLNEFFMADAPNIHSLLDNMDLAELSQGKHTREIVLNKLHKVLNASLELIED